MKICYIFRDPRKGGKSIEEIFINLAGLLEEQYGVQTQMFFYQQDQSLFSNVRRLRRIRADVYHVTGDINFLITFLGDKKTVLSIHDIGHYKTLRGLKKYLYGWWWLKIPIYIARRLTVVSTFTKLDLARIIPNSFQKTTVIYNPLPALFTFIPKDTLSNPPVILQVGAGEHKNLPVVVQAIQSMECKLIIIGPLSPRQRTLLQEAEIDYENYVNIDYKQVYQLYRRADLITFVSSHEGFGMPVIEAQGVGRPVITSPVCSIPEIGGDSVLMVEPHDVRALRQAIDFMLTDAPAREDYVERGIQNVKRFDEETIGAQYYDLYTKLLSH